MKRMLITIAVFAALLSACGQTELHFADPAAVAEAVSGQSAEEPASLSAAGSTASKAASAPEPPAGPAPEKSTPAETDASPAAPTQVPQAETSEAAPASAPVPEAADTAPQAGASLAYGGIPFELAAGTATWWQIDSSDSAYWAVQENLNAIRAAGGLEALDMDDALSAAAGARCESFVAGGPFDHSGMTTTSEICASGALGSASEVCTAWQGSPDHYANIMHTDLSRMGVACWFCSVDDNPYTYWVVTFA